MAWRRELERLAKEDAVNRLWAKDVTLWTRAQIEPSYLATNLAFLDLPDLRSSYIARVGELAAEVEREGFQDVVFIAMGDSNLAVESISRTAAATRYRRLFLLDSTDPRAIRAVDEQLDYGVTLFVFANKSGKRIETHALLLYFLNRLKEQRGSEPGRCCVALTEENSYLAVLAQSYGFRQTFRDPFGIKGRYSSLIHFGILLSAVWQCEPGRLVSAAVAMRELCSQPIAGDRNPAADLAALLAAGAQEGMDKLLLIGSNSLRAASERIAQLVGASMSKGAQGLIPLCELPRSLAGYKRGCVAAILKMQGDEDTEVNELDRQLKEAGVPSVSIEMGAPEELGAELFKWEIATALACLLVDANPFNEPDVPQGRGRVSEMLDGLVIRQEWPARTVRVCEKSIELYAEGETRQQMSTLNLSEALRSFFDATKPDGYLAILAFAAGHEITGGSLARIREQLEAKLEIPVLLSQGPRYLRYFEQVYKGGAPKGLFLMLTSAATDDLAIPGAGYTFGQLQLALALDEFESLDARRKLAVRLHFAQGLEQGLADMEQIVQKL